MTTSVPPGFTNNNPTNINPNNPTKQNILNNNSKHDGKGSIEEGRRTTSFANLAAVIGEGLAER